MIANGTERKRQKKYSPFVIELLYYSGNGVEKCINGMVYDGRDTSAARSKVTRSHLSFATCVGYMRYFLITGGIIESETKKKYLYVRDLLCYFFKLPLHDFSVFVRDFFLFSSVH